MSNAATFLPTSTAKAIAASRVKTLGAWIRKVDRWSAKCARLSAAEAGTAEHAAALAAWSKGGMPSKASKHHAYDDAGALITLLDLDVRRPQDVDGLRKVLTAATAALA